MISSKTRSIIQFPSFEISDDDLRKLSLVGGLMAKVAYQDREVTDTEIAKMIEAIENNWGLSKEESTFLAEVAVSSVDVTYDSFRMMRELVTDTTLEERRHVVEVLFAIAAADGEMSFDEIEEIRLIARGLELSHRDFIDAKLLILGEERIS